MTTLGLAQRQQRMDALYDHLTMVSMQVEARHQVRVSGQLKREPARIPDDRREEAAILRDWLESAAVQVTADGSPRTIDTPLAVLQVRKPDGHDDAHADPGFASAPVELNLGTRVVHALKDKAKQSRHADAAVVWIQDESGLYYRTVWAQESLMQKNRALHALTDPVLATWPHLEGWVLSGVLPQGSRLLPGIQNVNAWSATFPMGSWGIVESHAVFNPTRMAPTLASLAAITRMPWRPFVQAMLVQAGFPVDEVQLLSAEHF